MKPAASACCTSSARAYAVSATAGTFPTGGGSARIARIRSSPSRSGIAMSLKMEGFIVSNFFDMTADFHRDMTAWAKAGKMTWRETVVDGVANTPQAFIGLFKCENFGKMVVRVGPDKT